MSAYFPHRLIIELSNLNISETSWSILIKYYIEHHWDGDNAALRFTIYQNQDR